MDFRRLRNISLFWLDFAARAAEALQYFSHINTDPLKFTRITTKRDFFLPEITIKYYTCIFTRAWSSYLSGNCVLRVFRVELQCYLPSLAHNGSGNAPISGSHNAPRWSLYCVLQKSSVKITLFCIKTHIFSLISNTWSLHR